MNLMFSSRRGDGYMTKCMCRYNSSEFQSETPVEVSSGEVNSIVTSDVTTSVTSSVNTSGWIYESLCNKQCDKQCDEHVTDWAVLDSKKL